eukprot:scaffold59336_cov19-Tisochrysis_lutea.AAC.1
MHTPTSPPYLRACAHSSPNTIGNDLIVSKGVQWEVRRRGAWVRRWRMVGLCAAGPARGEGAGQGPVCRRQALQELHDLSVQQLAQ